MQRDHIDANELHTSFDRLSRDLAHMGHELYSKIAGFDAAGAVTHVERNHPILFRVEGCMHRQGQVRGDSRRWCRIRADRLVEEDSVALRLDKLQLRRRAYHGLEQTASVVLRVREAHAMQSHVPRVAADVRDHQQRLIDHPPATIRLQPIPVTGRSSEKGPPGALLQTNNPRLSGESARRARGRTPAGRPPFDHGPRRLAPMALLPHPRGGGGPRRVHGAQAGAPPGPRAGQRWP